MSANRETLKRVRKAKGLKVAEMARQLGISASFYYKIEAGIRNPTLALAKRIADVLGASMSELFFDSDLDVSSHAPEEVAQRMTS